MPWDDELQQLKAQVIGLFGKEAFIAAERRVLGGLTATQRSADTSMLKDVFLAALRVELRRLLRPH